MYMQVEGIFTVKTQKEQLHYHICITATISVFDFKMTQLQLSWQLYPGQILGFCLQY